MSKEQALLELTLKNAEQARKAFEDVFVEGIRRGVPAELLTRLRTLWDHTQEIAGEVIAIGKIIVNEIVAFLRSNPKIPIGAALGAAVALLIGAVPLIGPLLAPIAAVVGAIYGAGVGATAQDGAASGDPIAMLKAIARKFFELFVAVLNAVSDYWVRSSSQSQSSI